MGLCGILRTRCLFSSRLISQLFHRIGEHHGSSFCTVASFKNGLSHNQAHTVNIAQMLEQHNQKRNQAFSYFQQVSIFISASSESYQFVLILLAALFVF